MKNVAESVRQGESKPFVEEAVLQVSNWGFTLADLQVQKQPERKCFLPWLRSLYQKPELKRTGFLGPIHIWQVCFFSIFLPFVTNYSLHVID